MPYTKDNRPIPTPERGIETRGQKDRKSVCPSLHIVQSNPILSVIYSGQSSSFYFEFVVAAVASPFCFRLSSSKIKPRFLNSSGAIKFLFKRDTGWSARIAILVTMDQFQQKIAYFSIRQPRYPFANLRHSSSFVPLRNFRHLR